MRPHIAVSLLSFDATGRTLACIESLRAEQARGGEDFRLELWLLDNGSPGDRAQALATALPAGDDLHFEALPVNRGFAGGHNHNLARILAGPTPDFLWLLNNDSLVLPGCVAALIRCASSQPRTALWGATLLEPGGTRIQCAGGCFYTPWLSHWRPYARGCAAAEVRDLAEPAFDYLAGASLFLPVTLIEEAFLPLPGAGSGQLLNEDYFLYFEELDLARRLRPDYALGWCRDALLEHGTGPAPSRQRQQLGEYHASLSALKYTQRHHPGLLWLMAPARYLAKLLQHGLRWRWDLLRETGRAYRAWLNQSTHSTAD